MDKRLSYGKIPGRYVKMIESGEVGTCTYWDRVSKEFYIALDSFKSRFNPDGECACTREDFEVI